MLVSVGLIPETIAAAEKATGAYGTFQTFFHSLLVDGKDEQDFINFTNFIF